MRAGSILLALTLAASTLSADEDYAIRLSHPRKVGDRYRIDAKGENRQQQRITLGGHVEDESKEISVHLVAVATVLAVDSKMQPTRIEYLVEACQKTSSGKTAEVLPAGRKVVAESKERETVLTIEGQQQPDKEIVEALKVVISAHVPDSPTDDEIFGTRERKRVGDKWDINSAAFAADLSKTGLSVSAGDLKGTVQLDRVRTIGAARALEVSAHLRADRLKMDTPEWIRIEKASMEGDFMGPVPLDPRSRDYFPDKMKMHANILMGGKKPDTGEKIAMELSMEMSLENSYPPLQDETKAQSSRGDRGGAVESSAAP